MKRVIYAKPVRGSKLMELTQIAKDSKGTAYPAGWKFTLIGSDITKREVYAQAEDGRLVTFR